MDEVEAIHDEFKRYDYPSGSTWEVLVTAKTSWSIAIQNSVLLIGKHRRLYGIQAFVSGSHGQVVDHFTCRQTHEPGLRRYKIIPQGYDN